MFFSFLLTATPVRKERMNYLKAYFVVRNRLCDDARNPIQFTAMPLLLFSELFRSPVTEHHQQQQQTKS